MATPTRAGQRCASSANRLQYRITTRAVRNFRSSSGVSCGLKHEHRSDASTIYNGLGQQPRSSGEASCSFSPDAACRGLRSWATGAAALSTAMTLAFAAPGSAAAHIGTAAFLHHDGLDLALAHSQALLPLSSSRADASEPRRSPFRLPPLRGAPPPGLSADSADAESAESAPPLASPTAAAAPSPRIATAAVPVQAVQAAVQAAVPAVPAAAVADLSEAARSAPVTSQPQAVHELAGLESGLHKPGSAFMADDAYGGSSASSSFDLQLPLWAKVLGLVGVNVLGIQAVLALLKKAGDRSEPVSLVRLQLGLVTDHSHIRSRLKELAGMIQAGQQGQWLILEEALLEFSKYQRTCQLADVTAVHLESKEEAYGLFSELAKVEAAKARAEQAQAHAEGEGECTVSFDEADGTGQSSGLLQWLGLRPKDSGCDDAMVVTLLVATRGHIEVPSKPESWADLSHAMKGLCGLTSDRLMAVDLTWTPCSDGDYLTRDLLIRDYSNLRPIRH